LDCRIFAGFLEGVVPKERKYVGVFGKGKRRFLFRRKGNELRAFHRKKHPVRTNGNLSGAYHGCMRSSRLG